jgi:hypothetical protein
MVVTASELKTTRGPTDELNSVVDVRRENVGRSLAVRHGGHQSYANGDVTNEEMNSW